MKEEDKGFIEKDRKFRDRSKKKGLSAEYSAAQGKSIARHRREANELKPRHRPYKRKKDWMQLPTEDGPEVYNDPTYGEQAVEMFDPEVYDANYKEIS